MSDSVRPHGQQPTRLLCPWDSLGKNTGVGCHFLLHLHMHWSSILCTYFNAVLSNHPTLAFSVQPARCYQIILPSISTNLHFWQRWENSCLSAASLTLGIIKLFYSCIICRCEMISHFNWHVPWFVYSFTSQR